MLSTATWLCVAAVVLQSVASHRSHHHHHHHSGRPSNGPHHHGHDYCEEKCPVFDPAGDAVLLPGPTTTTFYKCNFGVGVLFTCPSGTQFNPRKRVCDWPGNARAVECNRSPDSEEEGSGEGSGNGDVFLREV